MFLVGVSVFAIASAGCSLAANIHELVAARAVQGFGAAFLVPGSLSIISASFSEQERGRAIGTWSGFTSIATATGPVLGGWLIENASWRWVSFINLPLAAAVIALSLMRVPESRINTHTRPDWTGALIVTAGLAGVTYGFIESANLGCLGNFDRWLRVSDCFRLLRGSRPLSHYSAGAVSVARFHRGQHAYAFSLRGSRNFLFLVPLESDRGPTLFGNGHGRGGPAVYPAYVLAVTLVWRTS